MKVVDLNVLICSVNSDAPEHLRARSWWERAVADEDPLGLPWIVVLGFLRLSTNARVFSRPLTPDEGLARIDAWLNLPIVRLVREKDDHWQVLKSLVRRAGTAGNLTTDAHLAALAISYDAVLVTCDADFARFAGLRRMNPLVLE